MDEALLAVIIALVSGGTGSLITGWLAIRKTNADATKTIAEAAQLLLKDYRRQSKELEAENQGLREEFRGYKAEINKSLKKYRGEQILQEKAIRNLNAKYRKLELALIINARQMRAMGVEPLISPHRLETITLEELRDIDKSLSNIERRRQKHSEETSGETVQLPGLPESEL